MKMKRVLAGIVIVQHDLYHLVLLQYECVRVAAIYQRVRCCAARGKHRVQRRYFRLHIADVVEEGVVCAVAKVVHLQIQVEGIVDLIIQRLFILRYERVVVEGIERVEERGSRLLRCIAVHKPAGHVGIEGVGDGVKQVLDIVSTIVHATMRDPLTVSMLPTMAKLAEVSFLAVTRKPYL